AYSAEASAEDGSLIRAWAMVFEPGPRQDAGDNGGGNYNYNYNYNYNFNDNRPPSRQSYYYLTPANQVVSLTPQDTQFIEIDIQAQTPAPTLNLRGIATITGNTFTAVLPGPISIWPFLGAPLGNTYVF